MTFFTSLRIKVPLIFLLILLLSIIAINLLVIENYRNSLFNSFETRFSSVATIVSRIGGTQWNNLEAIKLVVQRYSEVSGSRILIINNDKEVVYDSHYQLEGETISNRHVDLSLDGKISKGYFHGERITFNIAVPISIGNIIVGGVLVSAPAQHLFNSVNDLSKELQLISLIVGIIGFILIALFSSLIIAPIEKLTDGSKRLAKGELGYQVEVKRKDEIGELARNFNNMSLELYNIDKNRREFLGDVSHELKTPLASIKALVESLLKDEGDPSLFYEYLHDINGELDRLSQMVSSLLTFSRLGQERLELNKFELGSLLSETVNILRPLASDKGIEIRICNETKEAYIIGDKYKVKEILINLIDNGIKYSKSGSIITCCLIEEDCGFNLIVKDSGIGISKENLQKVFLPMFKIDVSRTKQEDKSSMGLGLAIVKKLVEMHNWGIEVKSKIGEGTEFKIIIPKHLKVK